LKPKIQSIQVANTRDGAGNSDAGISPERENISQHSTRQIGTVQRHFASDRKCFNALIMIP
jgi:hypothetical protein